MIRKQTVLSALLAILALPGPSLSAQELSPRDIASAARPAVVVVTALSNGREIGQASGFVVDSDGMVVTNWHVVENADAVRVRLPSGDVYDDNVYFVSADERRDLVIMKLPATNLQHLEIGDDESSDVGDPVYVMGNPLGLEGTFSDGLISARRFFDGFELIQISAPISSGSSGGPVLNSRGEVIGVATALMEDGQNLNLAVPARYASGLLGLDETPLRFSEAATTFTPPASDGGDQEDELGLLPWADVLFAEMRAVDSLAAELRHTETHEPYHRMINQGESHVFTVSLEPGYTTIAGVCDVDCLDLDLLLRSPSGEVVAHDSQLDDRPFLEYDIPSSATYEVEVYMADCSFEPCGFVVQTYKAPAQDFGRSANLYAFLDELEIGFKEVAPHAWSDWSESLLTSDPNALFARSAHATAAHTTDEELLHVLEWRSSTFRIAASRPDQRQICSTSEPPTTSFDLFAVDLTPVGRITGRAVARDYLGYPAWRSPVDLAVDEAVWEAFGLYLTSRDLEASILKPLLVLAEGNNLDDRTSCLWQSDLYRLATQHPNDRIGRLTLLEFVRAMDLLGASMLAME